MSNKAQVFVASVCALRGAQQVHGVRLLAARSPAEAEGMLLQDIREQWPPREGWGGYSVIVAPLETLLNEFEQQRRPSTSSPPTASSR